MIGTILFFVTFALTCIFEVSVSAFTIWIISSSFLFIVKSVPTIISSPVSIYEMLFACTSVIVGLRYLFSYHYFSKAGVRIGSVSIGVNVREGDEGGE